MARKGFHASRGQFLRQLQKWGLSKNLSSKQWKSISRKMKTRLRFGKMSQVSAHGRIISPEKVRKEVSRHDLPSYSTRSPSQDSMEGILVYTPRGMSVVSRQGSKSPQLMQATDDVYEASQSIVVPYNLPYFEFTRTVVSQGKSNRMICHP